MWRKYRVDPFTWKHKLAEVVLFQLMFARSKLRSIKIHLNLTSRFRLWSWCVNFCPLSCNSVPHRCCPLPGLSALAGESYPSDIYLGLRPSLNFMIILSWVSHYCRNRAFMTNLDVLNQIFSVIQTLKAFPQCLLLKILFWVNFVLAIINLCLKKHIV